VEAFQFEFTDPPHLSNVYHLLAMIKVESHLDHPLQLSVHQIERHFSESVALLGDDFGDNVRDCMCRFLGEEVCCLVF